MPYDLQTPFGTHSGQLTPAEVQMQALRRAVGNPEDAMRAGVAESKAMEAGNLGADPFFSKEPDRGREFVTAPDREWMAGRSGRMLTDATNRAQMDGPLQASRDADTESAYLNRDQSRRAGVAGAELDKELGIGGGMGAAPGAGMSSGDLLVGRGGTAAPAKPGAGGTGDDALMRLAILSSIAGGKGAPDIGSFMNQRSQSKIAEQRAAHEQQLGGLQMQEMQMKLAEMKRQADEAEALRLRNAGKPNTTGATLPRVDAASVASRPEAQRALEVAGNEAQRLGGEDYFGTNFDDQNPLPQDSQLDPMIDAAAQEFTKLGVPPDEARAFVLQQLQQKYGQDKGGLSIPYIIQKGQSAVAQHLGRKR